MTSARVSKEIEPIDVGSVTFSARGIGARTNGSGGITVKVEIVDETTKRVIDAQTYTGKDLEAVVAVIEGDLRARLDAESDQVLHDAVVGKTLASV